MSTPSISEQQQRFTDSNENPLELYRQLAVGGRGWGTLVAYEVLTGLGTILPGLLGYGFRSYLYPLLFGQCDSRPLVGRGVSLKNPGDVRLGKKVMIDDRVSIDCRMGSSVEFNDYVSIGKDTIVAAKGGDITLEAGVNVGTHCRIATQCGITIGQSSLIAAYAYIGPGNHTRDPETGSFISGEMELKGGVHIGKNVWIGTRATILDGVTIGDGAIVGAHSLVRESVPAGAVVAGTPAKVINP